MTAPPPVRAPADPSGADAPARPAPSARLSLAAAAWSAALGFALAVAAASLARAGAPLAGVALAAAAAAGAAGWLWVRRRVERPLSRVATAVGADGPGRVLESLADRASELGERLRAGEAQRARTEKMATVGRMAAGIAHEVGNPLAAINGYAHVLRSRSADRPDLSPVLDALERESARIDRIVRGLLEYARPRRITPA
jgi:signal transduction histidine kinase